MTWEPSKEAVERAAKVIEDKLGLISSGVEIAARIVARAALIAGHEEPAPTQDGRWLPRASAPKDGTYFLAWVPISPGDIDLGCVDDGDMRIVWWEGRGQFTSDRDLGDEPFTHWRPLPPAPETKK